MMTITRKIYLNTRGRRPHPVSALEVEPAPPKGRIPRISKLMALAIRFDKLIHDGVVADQSTLAELARVTQPRMTQIMNLLHLAPDIQEDLLLLPPVIVGRDLVTEKRLRPICRSMVWSRQRELWKQQKAHPPTALPSPCRCP